MSDEYRFLNPYNFVRYLPPGRESDEPAIKLLGRCHPPPHDRFIGLTGEIECELEAATPLFISDSESVEGDGHKSYGFFRLINEDGYEDFAIPSTSLRGMLRSVFEAATNSCFSVFEGGLLGKRERPERYDQNLTLNAGMIEKIPESKVKCGVVKSMTHYRVPHTKFPQYKNKHGMNGITVFVKIRNNKVIDVKDEGDSGYIKGYLKTSDKGIPGRTQKINEYVFVADNSSQYFKLSYETYQNYVISNRNNRNENTKNPKPGNTIWFRADEEKEVKEFGYAQIYRKPFEKSIGALLPEWLHPCSDYENLCPVCRVFGWVHQTPPKGAEKKVAYAGRVRISHAKIIENNGTLPKIPLAILSAPKPTTTLFYLLKDGRADLHVAYGTPGAELRGRKFYRHQREAKEEEYRRVGDEEDTQNRTIRDALNPGAKFCFTIRFENLSAVELGALLWSIEMEEGMYHKLGLAKPLGFGSIKISINDINIFNFKERYSSFTCDGYRSVDGQKKMDWVRLFKEAMEDRYGKSFEDLDNIQDIKAILSASSPDVPMHYPRISEEPDKSGKNFEWFMRNKNPLKIASEDFFVFKKERPIVSHMMKAIRLQRFKGYVDSGWIDLRPPLILLFGANSTGKSAILNALLMLEQSLEDMNRENPFVFHSKKGIDIGSFEDAVFDHEVDIKKPMIFSFEIEIAENFLKLGLSGGDLVLISIKVAYDEKRKNNVIIEFDMVRVSDKRCIFNMQRKSPPSIVETRFKSDLCTIPKDIAPIWYNFIPTIPPTSKINDEGYDGEVLSELSKIGRDIVLQFINYFRYVLHIGPLRGEPERTYHFTGETPTEVGPDGSDALQILYLNEYSKHSKNLIIDVSQWLENMGYVLEWNMLPGDRAQLMLKDNLGILSNLKDVGFGISQLLPILIQGYATEEEHILLLEQPEIHLHPRAQADLGDLFIALAQRGKSLIVETHSEHLMLRLRRRIAEQKVPKEMVGIYFIEKEHGESNVSRIELDEYGQMVNVPEGFKTFFSDDFEETMFITEQIAKRHAEETNRENSA